MRILFVAPYVPNPVRVRPYEFLRALAQRGHEITLATLWSSEEERAGLDALRPLCHRIIEAELPLARSLWNSVRAVPTPTPLQARYCAVPELHAKVEAALAAQRPDVVHVEHLRGSPYALQARSLLFAARPSVPVVWDSVDSISFLFEQAARQSRSLKSRLMTRVELGRTRRYEAFLVGQFYRTVVTAQSDADALTALARAQDVPLPRPIAVVPNGVDMVTFHPDGELLPDVAGSGRRIVLTGKMSYHANVSAAVRLVREIMPLVWAERPDAEVCLVGQNPSREVTALAHDGPDQRVVVTGSVARIAPWLRGAAVAAAPVPYGAGIQNKVLEAMACATPVVASPQAASALKTVAGRDLLVENDDAAFARAILLLLNTPQRGAEMGAAGRAYVEQYHSWQSSAAQLEAIYSGR